MRGCKATWRRKVSDGTQQAVPVPKAACIKQMAETQSEAQWEAKMGLICAAGCCSLPSLAYEQIHPQALIREPQ